MTQVVWALITELNHTYMKKMEPDRGCKLQFPYTAWEKYGISFNAISTEVLAYGT